MPLALSPDQPQSAECTRPSCMLAPSSSPQQHGRVRLHRPPVPTLLCTQHQGQQTRRLAACHKQP